MGVGVSVGVTVGVAVGVPVGVPIGVPVAVGVDSGVAVGSGVIVGSGVSADGFISEIESSQDVEVIDYMAIDVRLMVDGSEVQPDGAVMVSFSDIPLATEEGGYVGIAHLGDGSVEGVSGSDSTQEASIGADHFSVYVLYSTSGKAKKADGSVLSDADTAKLQNFIDYVEMLTNYDIYANTFSTTTHVDGNMIVGKLAKNPNGKAWVENIKTTNLADKSENGSYIGTIEGKNGSYESIDGMTVVIGDDSYLHRNNSWDQGNLNSPAAIIDANDIGKGKQYKDLDAALDKAGIDKELIDTDKVLDQISDVAEQARNINTDIRKRYGGELSSYELLDAASKNLKDFEDGSIMAINLDTVDLNDKDIMKKLSELINKNDNRIPIVINVNFQKNGNFSDL